MTARRRPGATAAEPTRTVRTGAAEGAVAGAAERLTRLLLDSSCRTLTPRCRGIEDPRCRRGCDLRPSNARTTVTDCRGLRICAWPLPGGRLVGAQTGRGRLSLRHHH